MFTDDSFNGKGFSAETNEGNCCGCGGNCTGNYCEVYEDFSLICNQCNKRGVHECDDGGNMMCEGHTNWFPIVEGGKLVPYCKACFLQIDYLLRKKEGQSAKLDAESHAYSYAYNEGHSDSRKDGGYNPIKSKQDLVPFKRVLKQKAESFNAEYPKGEKGYVIYSLGYNEGEQGKERKTPESFVSMIAKFNDIENSYMLSDDDKSYAIFTIGYFDGDSDNLNKRTPQAFELMLSKMGKSYGNSRLPSIPKTARLDAESFAADTNPRERRLRQRFGIKKPKPKSKPKKISNNFIEEGKIVTITDFRDKYRGKILNIWETGTFTYMNVAFPLDEKDMKMNEAEIKTNNPMLWDDIGGGFPRPEQTHWGRTLRERHGSFGWNEAYAVKHNYDNTDFSQRKGKWREGGAVGCNLKTNPKNFNPTKKPTLTPAQKFSLNWAKTQIDVDGNDYSYIETSNRGYKPHKQRVIQALLDKGLITIKSCMRCRTNRDCPYHKSARDEEAYGVLLTPLAYEYEYKNPFKAESHDFSQKSAESETFEDSCPICGDEIFHSMEYGMMGYNIAYCDNCDLDMHTCKGSCKCSDREGENTIPIGNVFCDCGFGQEYGSRTPCEGCEPISEKIESHNTKMNAAESSLVQQAKGIDTFTEPLEEIGVPKWVIGIGGVVAAITGINYLSKKL